MLTFVINCNQKYSEQLIAKMYLQNPDSVSTLIKTMLTEDYSRYNKADACIAAEEAGYTTDVFDYIKQIHVHKLMPFIIIYIAVMTVTVCLFIYYIYIFGRQCDKKVSQAEKDLETVRLKLETSEYCHEKREHELRQFIENIAHQVKTPLAVLITEIEVGSGKERQLIQTEKIRKLLDMLLKIARLEAGKVNFERNDEDMLNLICNICSRIFIHYRDAAPDNIYNIYIEGTDSGETLFKYTLKDEQWYDFLTDSYVTPDNIETMSTRYRAWCDCDWIDEALLNVIENSFKHSDDCRTKDINISLSDDEQYVIITISDSGDGIPEQYTERIFDRFFTCNEASYESTGIGLNLSKLIITQLGGDIRIRQLDEKQFFVITMPKYNMLKRREA